MKALNQVVVLLTVLVAFVSMSPVRAADDAPTWEVTGSTAALYAHNNLAGNGTHFWSVNTGGGYFFNNMLELGANVSFFASSGGSYSTKSLNFTVGPTINFLGTPENSFFATTQVGMAMAGNGDIGPNSTQFAYLVGVGKRVELVKHVTWSPEVSFSGVSKSTDSGTGIVAPSSSSLAVIPFQFSLLF